MNAHDGRSGMAKERLASRTTHDGVTLLELPCVDGHPCQTPAEHRCFIAHFSCVG